MLGALLLEGGWAVRGTSRDAAGLKAIEAAGIEPALADPDRPAGLLDLVGDVTVVHWLLGSARGEPETIAAIHGPRLERFVEKLVDTPVRGFVYEARGSVESRLLEEGREIVRAAAATWRIPVEVAEADPSDSPAWAAAMLEATLRLVR
jgi:uncharacterized protein YbjT (DUF2867 family)